MPRTAKVFMTNRSQAVRLPKEYQFSTAEVFIRKEGDEVILSPRPRDWRSYMESAPVASDAFMADHCFHLEEPPAGAKTLIGVGFQPTRCRSGEQPKLPPEHTVR